MKLDLRTPALLFCLLPALVDPVRAATIHADGGSCTLADAIRAANTDKFIGGCLPGDPGADTIVLDADVSLLDVSGFSTFRGGGFAGLPDVTDDLTITAGLGSVIRRDPSYSCSAATADPVFRFLDLQSGALVLENLSLEDGCFVASDASNYGGGIATAAGTTLTLLNVAVRDHGTFTTADNLNGGSLHSESDEVWIFGGTFEGINVDISGSLRGGVLFGPSAAGPMRIEGTTFRDIGVVSGGSLQGGAVAVNDEVEIRSSSFEDFVVQSSSSVQGGAVYVSGSIGDVLTVSDSDFSGFMVAAITSSAQGGVIFSNQESRVVYSIFSAIQTSAGASNCSGGAIYLLGSAASFFERVVVDSVVCSGGLGSQGGGLYRTFGETLTVIDSLFRNNRASFGAAGGDSRGLGGALHSFAPTLIEGSAFLDNQVLPGDPAASGDVLGGALYLTEDSEIRNSTLAGNSARAGDGQGMGVDAGDASGGAIALNAFPSGLLVVSHLTVSDNQAIAGDADEGSADGLARGGGILLESTGSLEIDNSILAGNAVQQADRAATGEDCFVQGTVDSQGFNLVLVPDGSCDFSAFGDVVGLDPELYPVADYGCVIPLPNGQCLPTAAIDQNSWAVDWGSCAESKIFDDARGFPRRRDIPGVPNLADTCDAGSFEARDGDGDGITDVPDLCPLIADPDQSDLDMDGVGDACDLCLGNDASGDADSDSVCDDTDVCPGFDDNSDGDGDAIPDGCDLCVGSDVTGDGDNDGICADRDCDDGDPTNACGIFSDGFESGDVSSWQ